ncbi:MAG: squalene/phytoene synthase family protein [Gemmatimonadota bacterium]|nr:squalene/phytoene synthase family protein [Gemmatimonadota bacterium]
MDDAAYDRCLDLARDHYENFPVRSSLLPRELARDLAAVYAFCRTTDDLGDEFPGDRRAALRRWEGDVRATLKGAPPADRPILGALAETAGRRNLEPTPFLLLIEANRRDQRLEPYADEAALLDYCRHSATPVGRMVLGTLGFDESGLHVYADATCIGLQLANFWQDLARDRENGRCYLPLDACSRHGVDPGVELERASASPALRGLVAELVERAREWLIRGWPLADRLPARTRPLVRGFSRGGWAICDAVAAAGYDTLSSRPTVGVTRRRTIAGLELLRAPRRGVSAPTRG